MPDIGQALREARMRNRIDMSQVESATKIRAKYLRALENEEWDLLPGPTFVKTFLRTYAEYLGLDARTLVEEYKQRYERSPTGELAPFAPVAAPGGGRHRRRRPIGVWIVLALVPLAVLGGLWLLGRGDDGSGNQDARGQRTPTPTAGGPAGGGDPVRLRITAVTRVRACVLDARGRPIVDGRFLAAGRRTRSLSSTRFRVGLDGGTARVDVGRRSYTIRARARPVGMDIRAGRRPESLSGRRIPTCR